MKSRILKNSFVVLLALTYLLAIPLLAARLFGTEENVTASVASTAHAAEPEPLLYNDPGKDAGPASPPDGGDSGGGTDAPALPDDPKQSADPSAEESPPEAGGTAAPDTAGPSSAPQGGTPETQRPVQTGMPGEEQAPSTAPGETGAAETAPSSGPPSGSGDAAQADTPPPLTEYPPDPEGGAVTQDTPPAQRRGTFSTVTKDYFDTALFIGDSRTVGLREYGDLDNADYFADVGMSVFSAFSTKVSIPGVGGTGLENLLGTIVYEKIYIMLGINELGYDYDTVVTKYAEVVGKIRDLAPDAIIFVCANLHVSEGRSSKDSIFNNPNIDKLNGDISRLADGETIFYLDINPVFDDGCGNLSSECTGDGTHLYAKYYKPWSDWLLTMGIKV